MENADYRLQDSNAALEEVTKMSTSEHWTIPVSRYALITVGPFNHRIIQELFLWKSGFIYEIIDQYLYCVIYWRNVYGLIQFERDFNFKERYEVVGRKFCVFV